MYFGKYLRDAAAAAVLGALLWAALAGVRRFRERPPVSWLTTKTVVLPV